jgi:hypothetical protein
VSGTVAIWCLHQAPGGHITPLWRLSVYFRLSPKRIYGPNARMRESISGAVGGGALVAWLRGTGARWVDALMEGMGSMLEAAGTCEPHLARSAQKERAQRQTGWRGSPT